MKLILLFKFCVKRIIFIMKMIKKINIVYVSGQPNTNTNTKQNEWEIVKDEWWQMLRSTALCYQSTQTCDLLSNAKC